MHLQATGGDSTGWPTSRATQNTPGKEAMKTAPAIAASAVAQVIRKALAQDENTPDDDRLSFRVLAEEALPLLEHMARQEEPAS